MMFLSGSETHHGGKRSRGAGEGEVGEYRRCKSEKWNVLINT